MKKGSHLRIDHADRYGLPGFRWAFQGMDRSFAQCVDKKTMIPVEIPVVAPAPQTMGDPFPGVCALGVVVIWNKKPFVSASSEIFKWIFYFKGKKFGGE